jgi:hypothetical protein
MKIFEEGHFVHEELEGTGVVFAADKEDEFGVWIEPVEVNEEVETLAGTRMRPTIHFNIWTPIWDDGDWSVGIQGGWIIGENKDPFDVAEGVGEAAEKAIGWVLNFNIKCAIDNALEADYWSREPEESIW